MYRIGRIQQRNYSWTGMETLSRALRYSNTQWILCSPSKSEPYLFTILYKGCFIYIIISKFTKRGFKLVLCFVTTCVPITYKIPTTLHTITMMLPDPLFEYQKIFNSTTVHAFCGYFKVNFRTSTILRRWNTSNQFFTNDSHQNQNQYFTSP